MSTSATMAFVLIVTSVLAIACITLITCWMQQRRAIWSLPIALCGLVALAILKGAAWWWWLWAIVALAIILILWWSWKNNLLNKRWFELASVTFMCAVIIAYAWSAITMFGTLHSSLPAPKTPNTSAQTTSKSSPNDAEKKVVNDLEANGWKQTDCYINSDVDSNVDYSTAGEGRYSKKRIQSAKAMINFLSSNKDGASTLMHAIQKKTGASKSQILDINNWVTVQPLISFRYPGNTSCVGGRVVNSGNRQGSKGDIFIAFVSPKDKITYVRGACGNFQVVAPVPTQPKTGKKPHLDPKDPSQDVGVNPAVAPWKKDDTGGDASKGHQVSNEDGSKVANGYQADPKKDAAEAAKAAAEQAAAKEAEHQEAASKATVVDSGQDHTSTGAPDW